MDQEKLISQSVIAVPVIHVTTCAIYLAGYSAGFGASVGTLFGAGDLFGVSVSELFWTYLAGVVLPLIALSPQLKPDYKSPRTRAAETGDQSIIDRVHSQDRLYLGIVYLGVAVWMLSTLASSFVALQTDHRFPYMECSNILAFGASFYWARYASTLPTSRATDLVITVLMALAIIAFGSGLSRGQGERRYPVAAFEGKRPLCGTWHVLRPVGERFIAVDSKGGRALINEACATSLAIPFRPSFKSASLIDLTGDWWNGR